MVSLLEPVCYCNNRLGQLVPLMPTITLEQICARLEREIELLGSLRNVARELGVSHPYLSRVLSGRRSPGPKLLHALNLRVRELKQVTYEPLR